MTPSNSKVFYTINKTENKMIIRRAITKKTSKKKTDGKEYSSYSITIPKQILDAIGVKDKLYFYYHEENIYLTSKEPEGNNIRQQVKPHITVSKASKNYENALKYAQRTISLPQLFYNTYEDKYCEITIYAQHDYVNTEYPLVKLEAKPLNTDEIYLLEEATRWITEKFNTTKK